MKWTDETVELLKKLHAQGLSAGQISDRFGCTRNSICGKLARLGYREGKKTRPRPRQLTAVRPRTSDPRPRKGRHPDHVFGRPNTIKPWTPPALTPGEREFILGRGVLLLDLEPGQCKWPINEPNRDEFYLFCGAYAPKGCPYCKYHWVRSHGRWAAEAA